MASIHSTKYQIFILFLLILFFTAPKSSTQTPSPNPWPIQFHSVLVMNSTTSYSLTDLWYDYPNGRNFNIIQKQLGGPPLYDLEWNNDTSFYYTLSSPHSCRTLHFEVGILRPNWLDGANYLGQEIVDGFMCNVWEKVDFIWYYEDVATKRPVFWRFFTGMTVHVITFEVGAVLEDSKWQAPAYCFIQKKKNSTFDSITSRNFMERLATL